MCVCKGGWLCVSVCMQFQPTKKLEGFGSALCRILLFYLFRMYHFKSRTTSRGTIKSKLLFIIYNFKSSFMVLWKDIMRRLGSAKQINKPKTQHQKQKTTRAAAPMIKNSSKWESISKTKNASLWVLIERHACCWLATARQSERAPNGGYTLGGFGLP